MSTVTVVIPCYNYGHFLEAAVTSATAWQPGVEVRVLVIDDASPDGSGDVARALARTVPWVRAVLHEHNQGHISTYNEGLAQVDTDYTVLLSADDLLAPGALARATAVLDAHPSVGLVYGRPRTFSEMNPPRPISLPARTRVWKGPDWIAAQARRGQSCIYSPEAVVRTRIQHQVGGYEASLPHSGDLEMWLRIAAVADVAHISGPDQAFRRMHPSSMMQTTYADAHVDIVHRKRAYDSFFHGLPPRHIAQAHASSASRRLAEEALEDLAGMLLHNVYTDSEIEAYISLASELAGESIRTTWQQREVQSWLRWRGGGSKSALITANALATRRRVEHRLRRYSWHWRGV